MAAQQRQSSKAVESYLRNFEGEQHRYQEILEVTLCYGIYCLSQNFSLKGIRFDELMTITKYDAVKKRDFYVRRTNVVRQPQGILERTEQQLRLKPSHSWRDGKENLDDAQLNIIGDISEENSSRSKVALPRPSNDQLVPGPEKPFDEIDFFTKILGKPFVDLVWTTFAGKEGAQITAMDGLHNLYTRMDQRKKPASFPAIELPVGSFGEFLNGYVTTCVSQYQRVDPAAQSNYGHEEKGELTFPIEDDHLSHYNLHSATGGQLSSLEASGPVSNSIPLSKTTKPKKVAFTPRGGMRSAPSKPHDQKQIPAQPRSLQHVRSKIQPELSARRDKILRVKKTQTQLMKESLAKARLAEYEARRHLDELPIKDGNHVRSGTSDFLATKRMPLRDITSGAAALEIVDDFMKGPLMDTFGSNSLTSKDIPARKQKTKDPLKEELYGTIDVDNSFLGCIPPSDAKKEHKQSDRPKRGYNGWLGDFGPLHTRTVRSEWTMDHDDDANEDNDGVEKKILPKARQSKFEWNFDNFDQEKHVNSKTRNASITIPENDDDFSIDNEDEYSDEISNVSDPDFRWLKSAV